METENRPCLPGAGGREGEDKQPSWVSFLGDENTLELGGGCTT